MKVAIATPKIGISILSIKKAGNGLARIVADISHSATSKQGNEELYAAFASAANNAVSIVEGSVRVLDQTRFTQRITAHVGVNREIVAFDDDTKGFRCVASNMFMDGEDKMWTLRKTAGGDILVQSNGQDDDLDIATMLKSISSTRHDPTAARFISKSSVAAIAGDFVSYVSYDNSIRQGFIACSSDDGDELLVVPQEGGEEEINTEAITENHGDIDVPDEGTEEEAVEASVSAARGVVNVDQLIEYYRRIYGRNKAYFDQLVSRIKSHQFA